MIIPKLHEQNGVVGLLNSHIKTLQRMGMNPDHDFIRGMERAIEIIEESAPKIVWKGDAE